MKYTLITGASQGIGEEIARQFAGLKKNLILVARSKEKLDHLAQALCQEFSVDVKVIECDLSGSASARDLFNQINQLDVEILVNNAGVGLGGAFMTQSSTEIEAMLNLNIMTVVLLTQLLIPKLISNHGSIINIASIAAFQPVPFMAVYAASKSFVLSWSEALSYELKKEGVSVLAVCPGWTKTGFIHRAKMDATQILSPAPQTPRQVALITIAAWKNNQTVVTSGVLNRFLAFGGGLLPRPLLLRLSSKVVGH
jgi:short-subunit dehydrogenase